MNKIIIFIFLWILIPCAVASSNEPISKQQEMVDKLDNLKLVYEAKIAKTDKYYDLVASALSYAEDKNYKKAIELNTSAIKLMPEKFFAYQLRGDIYKDTGKNKLAIKDYKTALTAINTEIASDPSAKNHLSRARLYYKLGNIDKAEEDTEIACNAKLIEAISFRNKINFDKIREKRWKELGKVHDFYSSFYAVLSSDKNIKSVGFREEYYNNELRDNLISEYKTNISNYNDISYRISTYKIMCSQFSASLSSIAFISENNNILYTIQGDVDKYSVILPDSNINTLFDKVCKKTK